MIMGFGGSQDSWPPVLVDALAVKHRVIIFDNAGIGQTAMPPGTLTISTMADQTAALIEALGLGQPAVLGWSMGGMIAQALAIRHPGDLSRLVLCATVPGDGTATVPPPATISLLVDAVTTGNTSELMPLLFPADQVAVQGPAYLAAILSYPNPYFPSSAVDEAQISAAESWFVGGDSGGHGAITVPTLIGDGADDVLTPPINSKDMKKSIPGAKLVNYPDAGHGFVVQDAVKWSKKIGTFLG
jgi:pimeloyl-ACP methyl ester carboxylesterase